jgi:glycosyltransferase involved in cell wall biosynthesis
VAERPLRIGLNLLFLVEGAAGAGRYALELLPSLLAVEPGSELTAFVGRDAPRALFEQPWSEKVEWVHFPVGVAAKTHLAAQLTALPASASRRRLDVLHSPANIGPLVTPRVARVVTLLDVIWLHQGAGWEQGRAARGFAFLSRVCARNADRVLTISHAARDDIVATLGLDAGKVDVAPLGVRPPPAGPETGRVEPDEPVVLCVAQKRPYKNLGSLIRAVAELEERPTLVLAGAPTAHEDELRALAAELGVAERVRFPGWVSEPELEALYRSAGCFVLPSLIEGFGLPVLEAMARDVPVACSNRPALPEVAGDAALLFDPEDQEAVTAAVGRLLRDEALARTLVERGRQRVREFTWERTARATLESYRKALAGKGRLPAPV